MRHLQAHALGRGLRHPHCTANYLPISTCLSHQHLRPVVAETPALISSPVSGLCGADGAWELPEPVTPDDWPWVLTKPQVWGAGQHPRGGGLSSSLGLFSMRAMCGNGNPSGHAAPCSSGCRRKKAQWPPTKLQGSCQASGCAQLSEAAGSGPQQQERGHEWGKKPDC